MYQTLRRGLFLVDPERIHTAVFAGLRAATATSATRNMLRRRLSPQDPALASTVFGVRFPGPLGLAAGFDKDGLGVSTWGALGFGYAEVGTVTARPQPGNPAPRLFRLPEDRALLNRMGFNNHGAAALAAQLGARRFEPFLKETVARIRLVEGRRHEAAAVAEEALAQLRDLDAMAFIGPWLLSTVALTTPDAGRRAEALAEGEARLRDGAVGHNYFQFYGNAMEANANVGDWAEMRRHADLLAEYTAEEPTPWSEFFIARAHAITDAAAGRDAGERLRALREQALAAQLHTAVPGIDRALATISAGVNKATV